LRENIIWAIAPPHAASSISPLLVETITCAIDTRRPRKAEECQSLWPVQFRREERLHTRQQYSSTAVCIAATSRLVAKDDSSLCVRWRVRGSVFAFEKWSNGDAACLNGGPRELSGQSVAHLSVLRHKKRAFFPASLSPPPLSHLTHPTQRYNPSPIIFYYTIPPLSILITH
jgi:hypothetical protein